MAQHILQHTEDKGVGLDCKGVGLDCNGVTSTCGHVGAVVVSAVTLVMLQSHLLTTSWWNPSSQRNPRGKKDREGTAEEGGGREREGRGRGGKGGGGGGTVQGQCTIRDVEEREETWNYERSNDK